MDRANALEVFFVGPVQAKRACAVQLVSRRIELLQLVLGLGCLRWTELCVLFYGSLGSSFWRSFKEMIVTPHTKGCPRINLSFPPLTHHHQEVNDILLSLPKKKALGWDMASQLTCYVCVPMVHCRQSSRPISNKWVDYPSFSDGAKFPYTCTWKLPLAKKNVWLDRTTTDQLRFFQLLAKFGQICLSFKSFIIL